MMEDYYDAIELENLYLWVDSIPLSRPKNNIGKDFSDAVLMAEIIKYYFPCLVDTYNYHPAVGPKRKMENWFLLNRKVLYHLGIELTEDMISALANGKQNVVEKMLMILRYQIDKYMEKFGNKSRPSQIQRNNMVKGAEVILNTARSQDSINNSSNIAISQKSQPVIAPVSDNVPKELLEEKLIECNAKNETMQILTVKIKKMEHLLQLKESKIQEFEERLKEISMKTF